ncbi:MULTISPECIES: argininosuccinate lyase [unclassified Methanoregula]|uniref:argininosuccinate lyase n=1 Tax=unclassified Methanoregula TaxID=2649730 RepID=UPI0009CFD774|nr:MULTISPECIES: argininosuccinate lyase [unclassified Methanoregula]OPX62162.1 MAG: Fumarate hydratase class II [Methanoregula sp. PtaB.Bin085]OPY35629.1 MAG: Fumarate hydratase class II [Methanoregula sp. PtaU1.Bin006]
MRTDVVRLGRLSGKRSGAMMHFLSSMQADRHIADADILVDIAHVLMLDKQKILDRSVTKKLLPALLQMYDEGVPEEAFDDRFEDIHAGIESFLIADAGPEIGGRLHIGRSRNDEVATCIRIRLREEILKQMAAILKIRTVLIALADRHKDSVMPGFTHLQHAQPTTLAHHLLAYEQSFSRDFDRLRDAYTRVNLSPLGAAAFASTGYPVNRDYTASLLGFDGLVTNTMDAVATRDFALETLADIAILMANISRLCEELIVWSTSFVRFVSLDDAFCSTSSIMPQKKNPDIAEIMRAKSGSVFGALTGALVTVKGIPMSYNRDLQELTPHVWRGMHDAKESLQLLGEMLASAEFDTARMKEEAAKGFSTATELADSLARAYDIPFRTAHNIVGRAVQKGDLSLATLEKAAKDLDCGISFRKLGLTQAKINRVLDPEYSISLRKAPGAPAPVAIKGAIHDRKKQLAADTNLVEQKLTKTAKSRTELIAKARRLVA